MYEQAESTRLIATHCACCGRPLRDAASVEAGVGPECRRRYGLDEVAVAPDWTAAAAALAPVSLDQLLRDRDARAAANALAHAFAVHHDEPRRMAIATACNGQGYARTRSAEAVEKVLEAAGFEASVYYQMD